MPVASTHVRRTRIAAVFVLILLAVAGGVALAASRSDSGSWPARVPVSQKGYPAPLQGAIVSSRQFGSDGLGVSLLPRDGKLLVQVSAVGPQGNGLPGLDVGVTAGSRPGAVTSCGKGCYGASLPAARAGSQIILQVRSGSRSVRWPVTVPAASAYRDASPVVLRAARTWRSLRTLAMHERLASTAAPPLRSAWRIQAPDRLTYAIDGGSSAVIVGARRWDRETASSRWVESPQSPVTQPFPAWQLATDAHVVGTASVDGRPAMRITFFDPGIPAWFEILVDRTSLRTLQSRMIAASHFMVDDFSGFNSTPPVEPPR
jgi:hypothetical protein